MPYRNKGLKKTNEVKLRFSDFEIDDLEVAMEITGAQRAVWIRDLVMREVEEMLRAQDNFEQAMAATTRMH